MRYGWLGSVLVGLIVFVALKLLPASINGNEHALIAAAIAFVASILVRRLPLLR